MAQINDEFLTGVNPLKQYAEKAGGNFGDLSTIATKMYYGINHRSIGTPARSNNDDAGLTFFTRPRMNLSYDNISGVRHLSPLLTEDRLTLQRMVRVLLDPESARGKNTGIPVSSPLVDDKQAFIPLFTNLLTSISGFPDSAMDVHTSPEGVAKETWSMVDSLPNDYSTFDLTMNFRNVEGDPITLMLHTWTQYAARVAEGSLMPWADSVVENEMDYNTRIYRLVLDPSKKWVQKIAAVGYAFPYVNPIGAAFNMNSQAMRVTDNDEISVPFKCNWFFYNDPIIISEFNQTVVIFNPLMDDDIREDYMVKLDEVGKRLMNHKSYPRISEGNELEWWAESTEYELVLSQIDNAATLNGIDN